MRTPDEIFALSSSERQVVQARLDAIELSLERAAARGDIQITVKLPTLGKTGKIRRAVLEKLGNAGWGCVPHNDSVLIGESINGPQTAHEPAEG